MYIYIYYINYLFIVVSFIPDPIIKPYFNPTRLLHPLPAIIHQPPSCSPPASCRHHLQVLPWGVANQGAVEPLWRYPTGTSALAPN